MSKKIIGLVGFKGSGKDTVGEILCTKYSYTCTSFALGLKSALCAMFGWHPTMMEGKTAESRAWREQPDTWWSQALGEEITPRTMMQQFGTQIVRRRLHPKFWVLRTQLHMQTIPGDVVITDVRFPDELQMIRDQGGVIVHVKRGALPSWYNQAQWINQLPLWITNIMIWFMPSVRAVHESERNWIGLHMDHVIENSGTLAHLEAQVDQLLQKIQEEQGYSHTT